MKKSLGLLIVTGILFSQAFAGIFFTNTTIPLTATGAKVAVNKVGYASSYSIFGLVTFGDAGVKAAAENGNVGEIAYVDSNFVAFPFFVFTVNTTVVSGN